MREVVDLPDAKLAALDAWRATRGMSRAEAIEQAVTLLIEHQVSPANDESVKSVGRVIAGPAFGLWKNRSLDGLAEQERMRAEWDDR